MNILILTMHRVRNSGSFLQAYALKKMIEGYGYSVRFVDYEIVNLGVKHYIREFVYRFCDRIILKIGEFLQFLGCNQFICYGYNAIFLKKYKNEYIYDLGVGDALIRSCECRDADALIIGSDEVFNILQFKTIPWELLGDGSNAKKIISYAASCGGTRFDDQRLLEYHDKIKGLIGKFNSISVRDENTYKFVEKYYDGKIHINVDPVLAYDFDDIALKRPLEEEYLLVYGYPRRINDEKVIEKVRAYAKQKKLRIICVNFAQSWCDEFVLAHPLEVLSYFRFANAILTDTFHGVVMSIKYKKNFATLVRESNKDKMTYLLKMFNLENRIVYKTNNLENLFENELDKDAVDSLLEKYKTSSRFYLEKALRR